jgi:hypothetical protein
MTTPTAEWQSTGRKSAPVFRAPRLNLHGGILAGTVASAAFWLLANAADNDRITVSLVLRLSGESRPSG